MRELRLRFSAGDFGAVSQILVDMGIAFHVEPVEAPEREADAPVPAHAAVRRRLAKKPRKAGRKAAAPAALGGGEAPVSAVSRLRAALTQNRVPGAGGEATRDERGEDRDMPSPDERDV